MYDQEYMTRKLAHYNEWLLNPKRASGTVYPGFPEEVKMAKAAAAYKEEFIAKREAKAKVKAAPKAKKAKKVAGAPTKQEQAVAIYTRLGGDKAAVVSAIQAELGMSLAGATTYFYNSKKLA
jgi:hypothetical protein